ncbi:DUF1003 domain-containing protein [Phenylobacterium sp. J426]|uniref:DUF1003 domain-containing protein n=1 Tax=Phenylobacterium sp. J426 TaxID=2898439 RepID=UPI002150E6C5|nr:DUF1003 domain-containing protein [Phenylobacterium sp. J426]MCR5876139.1 DUF1003 domain-containing protein [Phenylobacterium sp. J426]
MTASDPPGGLTYPAPDGGAQDMAAVLRRNIEAMRAQRRREEETAKPGERIAERITRFTGSLIFVYVHLLLVAAWTMVNLGAAPGLRPFDPSFVILATVASVEAIFLSTFVLISQNRISALADKRAALDLQIDLLAEYEITQLVKLTTAIAEKVGVDVRRPEIEEISREVAPEAVLQELDVDAGPGSRDADRG